MKTEPKKAHEYRILRKMNNQNAICVLAPSANRVFQVVEFEDDTLRDELSGLDPGKLVELKLERVGNRSNVWRANWPENVQSLIASR